MEETQKHPEILSNEEIMKDLYDVGLDKPLGYLPKATIESINNQTIENVEEELHAMGLHTIVFDESECHVASGALYAYHLEALQSLLNETRPILERNNWPIESEAFVHTVATTFAQDPDLFRVVAWSFKDPRPEFSRDSQ